MVREKVKIGNFHSTLIGKTEARQVLRAYNKATRKNTHKGVSKMSRDELEKALKSLDISYYSDGHKILVGSKIKSDGKTQQGFTYKLKPLRVKKEKPPKPPKKKKEKKAGTKGAKSKTHTGEDYTGHTGNISKSKGKDTKADNPNVDYKPKRKKTDYQIWITAQLKSGRKMKDLKGEWAQEKHKKSKEHLTTLTSKKKKTTKPIKGLKKKKKNKKLTTSQVLAQFGQTTTKTKQADELAKHKLKIPASATNYSKWKKTIKGSGIKEAKAKAMWKSHKDIQRKARKMFGR